MFEINQNYVKIENAIKEDSLNDLQKWIRIRKDLYLQMERQVKQRLGEDTPELRNYQKIYQSEFLKKWKVSNRDELLAQVQDAKVVLIGDFHALHQSQKAQLRVLRQIPKERPQVLAVEFFEAADQSKVERFVAGKMSEKEFLKAIRWEERWGFPWEHYRPLLRWAQKNKIPVYGLNKTYKKRNAATLLSRDVFAGQKIAQIVEDHPDALVTVIYGDLHLAASHIPAQIVKNLGKPFAKSIVRIFQNAENIYFQLLKQKLEATTDVIRMSQNTFCLMSVPPWVKWQNYLLYVEQVYDMGLSNSDDFDDDDDDEVESLDYTDHVGRYVKIMSEELGAKITADALSVYTAQDESFWNQVRESYDAKTLRWIEAMISEERSFYLPEIEGAYLARATVNHAASLAMSFVHAKSSQVTRLPQNMPEEFNRLIWEEAIAYFGSKIINHKRKTDTLVDIKASLAGRGLEQGKESLQLALGQKMHELMVISGLRDHRFQAKPRKKWSYIVAADLLGGMMGERLYNGYQKRLLKPSVILSFLKKPTENLNFPVAYYEILEVVESLPASFQSKKEKL